MAVTCCLTPAIPLLHLLLLLLLLSLPPLRPSEYTVVMPDSSSSTLVDSPQVGFSDRAKTDPAEQRAVYEVMAATGNVWAESIPDVCRGRWHGIECMPDTDDVYHVVSLAFGALSDDTAFPTCDPARAAFSPALLALPHLRSLFFYRCFTGRPRPIPSFLGGLPPTLRSLVLRENALTGPITADLANLTSLRVLDLHGNRLSSSIPPSIGRLKSLQLLDLSHNQLSGQLPEFDLPSLTAIDISHNLLQGPIPATLGRCGYLLKMDLSRNRLSGSIPNSLGSLTNLILLDLSRNWLNGPFPSSLPGLRSLTTLILNGNSMISATIPEDAFAGLTELNTLVLSNMGLQGPIPQSIGELANLRVLHLDGNRLNGSVPQSLGKLEKLSELRLNDNMLSGPIPVGREMLWKMGRKLRVENNQGLCYQVSSNGRYEGIESMWGISHCEVDASEGGHTTKHYLSSSSPPPSWWWRSRVEDVGQHGPGNSTLISSDTARKFWLGERLLLLLFVVNAVIFFL